MGIAGRWSLVGAASDQPSAIARHLLGLMRHLFLLVASLIAAAGCRAQPDPEDVRVELREVALGDSVIHLRVTTAVGIGATLLVLHDDENTGVDAGMEAIRRRGGRLVEVRAQGERMVAFAEDGRGFRFDPNRVFTAAGVRNTLDRESGGGVTDEALEAVERFAEQVMTAYRGETASEVITLHNNTDAGYSAASYVVGADLATDAAAVHLPPGADPDDFFFVTTRPLFDALADRGFAVVLQDNSRVTDDGSLSVWAGRRDIRYVNIEAQHGHLEQQIEMLDILEEVIGCR